MDVICQINYNPELARMFARLAQNMVNDDLMAGPPRVVNKTTIVQLVAMCPQTSGSESTFIHLGNDIWHVSYDDGEDSAELPGPEIHRWFTGDY